MLKQGERIIKKYHSFIQKLRSDNKKDIILSVISYINDNFKGECTLDECSKVVNTNSSYLSKCFKKEMHISFSSFVNEKKIRYAQYLLLTTSKHINDISYECGFSSASYFCTVFHKITNIKANEYRKAT